MVEVETKLLATDVGYNCTGSHSTSLASSEIDSNSTTHPKAVKTLVNPLESIDSHNMETDIQKQSLCKTPYVTENYSIVQLVADSIKAELKELTAIEHSNQTVQPKSRHKIGDQKEASKERLKCDECTKIFKSKSAMIEHLIVHTNERPFQCWLCGKKWVNQLFF